MVRSFLGSDTYHDFDVDHGKIQHPYAGAGYREGIKNLARWYKEGLVDAEIFIRGSSSRDFLLSENLGGATRDWFASTSGYNRLSKDIEGFEFNAFTHRHRFPSSASKSIAVFRSNRMAGPSVT